MKKKKQDSNDKKFSPKRIFFYFWLTLSVCGIVWITANSPGDMTIRTIRSLVRLLTLVGIAAFTGAVFEYKAWFGFASFLARPLISFGRLSGISGAAFITAIFSNNAANTLVAGSYSSGKITRKEMLISGLCNAYPAMISHSMRVLFPLLSAIGIVAVWYYSITFGIGLIMTLAFLLYHRLTTPASELEAYENAPRTQAIKRKKVPNWNEVLKKSTNRAFGTVLRLVYITVPIYFAVAYLIEYKKFDSLKDYMPSQVQSWLTPEMTAVITAQLGGLVNAAGVASGFLVHNKITEQQILVAYLLGNVLTSPIRTVRRNLPSAMGIFPGKDGLLIVLTLQGMRLIMVTAAIVILVKVIL